MRLFALPSDRDASILPQQVELLYRGAREAFLFTFLNVVLLASVQGSAVPWPAIAAWVLYMVIVTGVWVALVQRYWRAPDRDERAGMWKDRYAAGAALAGAGWGAAGILLFPPDSMVQQMFVFFVLAGMSAGAVVLLTARMEVLLAFVLPALLPPIVHLLTDHDSVEFSVGVILLLFTGTLLVTGWRTHAMLAGSLTLSLRNAELVDRLSSEKNKAEELNQVLRQEIQQREGTERALRESQEQLVHAQKMEAVGQLAGGIAHDFNNLLQVIGGYSQLATKDPGMTEGGRRQVQQIKEASDRARSLTMKLLAFSRRQVLQSAPLDLNAVIVSMLPMMGRLIGENIELRTELAPDLGRVLGDGIQLEQVLLNLVVNAKDAMPNGGLITIDTANVVLDDAFVAAHRGSQPGQHVRVRVADTGEGMDAETQRHIFEPFFTTKQVGQGTGLGLAVVYGIIKQTSGYVEVVSAVDRGTLFSVYLPRQQAAVLRVEPVLEPGEAPRGRETVLVVEDEKSVRELIAEVLRDHGYVVLEATDGENGWHMALHASAPISLLLTDLVMPRMGGRELAHRLRARQSDLKIIYMSGYEAGHGRPHVLDPEITHLQKPFGPDVLARKVREVLDA